MDKTDIISIDDLCRLCLSKKSSSSLFIKLNETHSEFFNQLTNRDVSKILLFNL